MILSDNIMSYSPLDVKGKNIPEGLEASESLGATAEIMIGPSPMVSDRADQAQT